MTPRKRGQSPARATDRMRLKYEEIRDRFIAEPPATNEEALDYFVRLGMYIYGRWEAIGADTPDGQRMDEDGSKRWDECTDGEFDEIRSRAAQLIDSEVARRRIKALFAALFREPWGSIVKGISWAFMRAWEHFVGAFGLVAFGLLLVWAFPHIVKDIRSAINQALPQETRPTDLPVEKQTNSTTPDSRAGNRQ